MAKQSVVADLKLAKDTFAPALTAALWDLSEPQIEKNLEGLSELPSVVGIRLVDEYGHETHKVGKITAEALPETASATEEEDQLRYSFELIHEAPAGLNKHTPYSLGNATLYSDTSVVVDRVKVSYLFLIGNALIKTIALWLLLNWAVKKLISRPLYNLTHEIAAVDLDSLEDHKIDLGINDRSELNVLQDAFNRMLQKLDQSHGRLRQFSNELEQKVTERTEELKKEKEKAETATKTKSEFLANMSHEIRTPLNAIMGMIHLAMKTDLNEKQRNYLSKTQSSSRMLLRLINDILDFSKLEANKLEIEKTEFRLDSVFVELSDMFSPRAHEKGIEIAFKHPTGMPYKLIGDPLRLTQVLTNLLSNGIKFTSHGGITVDCSITEQSDDGVRLAFVVRDTGIGMTEEQLAKLFQAFNQADTSTTRRFGGTGLGLVISRRLVNLMGGEISVNSTEGEGSEFCFDVSFETANLDTEITKLESLEGKKALIVDDSGIARDTLSTLLRSFHFEVREASSAEDGLKILEESLDGDEPDFDVVLMDWRMPGMDGIEASRKIRQDPRFQKLRALIMVTAYPSENLVKEAETLGLSGFLQKPVPPSLLLETLSSTLGEHVLKDLSVGTKTADKDYSALAGLEVLLVDDNDLNREVATGLLEDVGVKVLPAADGFEAIQLVQERNFDLVLMDIQMPGMDGYTATGKIRELPNCEELPIIAMTANALSGDREKCLNAGMNDHVPKPIEPDLLYSCLMRYKGDRQPQEMVPEQIIAEDQEALPDHLPGINIETGLLYVNGDRKRYLKLLRQFRTEYAHFADDMLQQLQQGDMETASRHAHTLKGVSGSLGALELFNSANALDMAFKNESLDEAKELCEQEVSILLKTIIDGLDVLGDTPQKVEQELTPRNVKEDVTALIALLRDGDFNVSEKYELLRPRLLHLWGEEVLQPVTQSIEDYEFEIALEQMEELRLRLN